MRNRNKYDRDGECLRRGNEVVEWFIEIAKTNGYKLKRFATKAEDTKEHWDILLEKDDKPLKFEIKSAKKIRREDKVPQFKLILLEIMTVSGDPGWVYGNYDYIAFSCETGFLVIAKQQMNKFLEGLKLTENPQISADYQPYTIYRRRGRQDAFMFVERSELEKVGWYIEKI